MISNSTRCWSTGITGWLHHKDIDAPHIFEQLKINLSIGKALQLAFAEMNTDMGTNILGQFTVGRTGKDLEALVFAQSAGALAFA